MPITPQEALLRCIDHREIFHDEMLHLFRQIMAGEMSPTMVAALTMGLRVKKETIGEITAAAQVMHGKTSMIAHTGEGVFQGLPSPFTVIRYHSLAIERASLPACLEVTAWTDDGEIMGVRHKEFDIQGVQFHPESILSEHGHALFKNFLEGC